MLRQPRAIKLRALRADTYHVTLATILAPAWWNWRISAHCRLASLASAWAIVALSGVLGPLLIPITGARFVASLAQTWLNIRLGKAQPVASQDRIDYALIGLVFVGAYVAVGIGHLTGSMTSPVVYLPMLVPFSLLQVRMTRRAYQAHDHRDPAAPIPFPQVAVSETPARSAA